MATGSNRKGSQFELKKTDKNKKADIIDSCRVCNEKVTGDHKGIECEMCKQFHAACEDIEDLSLIHISEPTRPY